tara:strand:+ start:15465 stop:15662 length:198 start_codon:yes stop_codon:yes gene_type:complete
MKIVASVSIEVYLKDTESLDDGNARAIEELMDYIDNWINEDGIPPIIKIEYKLPQIDEEDNILIN